MDLVTPSMGLIIWQIIIFALLLIILRKFAWGPIIETIGKREKLINDSLEMVSANKKQIEEIENQRRELIKQSYIERDHILRQAQKTKEDIETKGRQQAQMQAELILKKAKEEIENEKNTAIAYLKNQVAEISIGMAEKLLREELKEKEKQKNLIEKLIKEIEIEK